MIKWCLVLVTLVGCVGSSTVHCSDGRLCPDKTVCDEVHSLCVDPSQLTSCSGMADATACTLPEGTGGVCRDQVCLGVVCGDGIVLGNEACDPAAAVNTASCSSLGFYGGTTATCRTDCTWDTTACTGICGDGVVDSAHNEACDRTDIAGATCQSLGFYDPGPVTCNAACRFDTAQCTGWCGDHVLNGSESCDGGWTTSETCLTYGRDAGHMNCIDALCAPSFAQCVSFGWRASSGPPTSGDLLRIAGNGPKDIWAVGTGDPIHFDGTTWKAFRLPGGGSATAVVVPQAGEAWAVGTAGRIVHFTGGAWTDITPVTSGPLYAIWAAATDDIYAVGYPSSGESVLHYNGSAWSVLAGASGGFLDAVWGTGPSDVWLADLTHWNGTSWTQFPNPSDAPAYGFWGASPTDVWAAVDEGVMHWDGSAWTLVPINPPLNYVASMWGTSTSDVWGVGEEGTIHFDGHVWSKDPSLTPGGIWGSSAGDVWAVGANNVLLHMNAGEWHSAFSGGVPDLWARDADDVWVVGTNQTTHFDGAVWTAVTFPSSSDIQGVWSDNTGNAWGFGGFGGANVYHSDGSSWTMTTTLPQAMQAIWGLGPSDIWIVGAGLIAHYDGSTWGTTQTPTQFDPVDAVWGTAPGDVWAVGKHILHYTSSTWTESVTAPAGVMFKSVWGSGPSDVWVVGDSDGTVAHYDGATWTVSPHLFATDALVSVSGTAPDDVWVLTSVGVLWHYNGVDWTQVRTQGLASGLKVAATGPHIFNVGNSGEIAWLSRYEAWDCAATETTCGDGLDNDCDGKTDVDDPDCTSALVLRQVAGGTTSYVEVENRSTKPMSLEGITLDYSLGCATGTYRFPSDAIVPAGGVWRAVSDLKPHLRERYSTVCDTPTGSGYVILCSGTCDRLGGSNVLDVVAKGAPTLPAGVTFTSPIDVSAATVGEGITRVAHTASGAHGAGGDWAVQAQTRQ